MMLGTFVATLALVLSACGSSGSGGKASGGGGKSGASGSTLTFGSLGTDTGPIGAAQADGKAAVQAWEKSINAQGGLAGHKVNVIFANDGGANPAQALTALKRLVEQDHVIALVGFRSQAAPALQSYIDAHKIPVVGAVGGNQINATDKYFFDPTLSETTGVEYATVDTLKAAAPQAKKMAIIYCQESPACVTQKTEISQVAGKQGIETVYTGQASLAAPDFTAQVLAARKAGAQVIYLGMDNPSSTHIIQDAARQNWYPVFMGNPTSFVSTFKPSLPANVKFYNWASEAPYTDSPAMAQYRAAINKYAPGAEQGNNGGKIWAGLQLLSLIAPHATWTPAGIYTALLGLKNVSLGGIVPPITFNDGPHAEVNTCTVPLVWKGSGWQQLNPGAKDPFVCAPKQ